jgi:hypothetical protein
VAGPEGFFSNFKRFAPFANLEALTALSALLYQVLKSDASSSNTRLANAYGVSRDQHHGTEDDDVSDPEVRVPRS